METRNFRVIESEFLLSADYFCSCYGLQFPDLTGLQFPVTEAHIYAELKKALAISEPGADLIIFSDDKHKATLATIKTFNTGRCLYYIPVKPLWHVSQRADQQALANLLLSIFAYLHQVAGIPFYREQDSYLREQYDYLRDWINEDSYETGNERKFRDQRNAELSKLEHAGDLLLPIIADPRWLTAFEDNLKAYRGCGDWDFETEHIAEEFLSLYRAYPKQTIFEHIRGDIVEPDEDQRLRAYQYISFYWSGEDNLNEDLFEMLNYEFQEYGITDEPTSVQIFDKPETALLNDFVFEEKLFELINRLCETLTPFDRD